jgi:Dehydrogenases with different specificities (related to short-chain alcohol dehydrogenases)
MLLKDQVAVVTGGAKGMGRSISVKFAEEGASVVIADIDLTGAQKVAGQIISSGGKAIAVKTDITNKVQIQEMVDSAINQFGKIDILINNAGGVPGTDGRGDSETIVDEEWDRIMELNLKGTLNVTLAILPHMKQRNFGKIVNFSSMGAFNCLVPVLHYHASKGAIESLTTNLAFELAPQNIHVNTIVPGPIVTPFWDELMPPSPEREAFFNALCHKEVPLGRMGTPEDIAGVALFLASPLSDYVTGQKIYVGGGLGCIYSHESTFLSCEKNENK